MSTQENSAEKQELDVVDRYMSFSLGEEHFAIPLLSVKEVIGMPEITPVPHSPSYFQGIMNLRGQIISVIDLRQKLNFKSEISAETTVIICDLSPYFLGIVVDSVDSVLSPSPESISPKPNLESKKGMDFVSGVIKSEDRLVLLIDIARTLNVDDQRILQQAGSK